MKRSGGHPQKSLSAAAIRNKARPGRYADGNGLYLVVDPSGAKRWVLRTVVQGHRRDMGLGSTQLVALADARETATRYRRLAREGGDPLAERRRQRVTIPTFEAAAHLVHQEHAPAWRNGKHNAQWLNTLRDYVFPIFGNRPVDEIDTPQVLRALSPIWLAKPETARRVRQRIKVVLDWAKASGFRSDDNPVDGVTKGLPRPATNKTHHAAMQHADVPKFMTRLVEQHNGMAALALQFLILTAARTGEVLHAAWSEIDIDDASWIIPAQRMKSGRQHRVPLTPVCIELLHRARALGGGSPLVFPGTSPSKPMSNMVFLMLLRRMQLSVTVHGFRSSFRDWAAETTHFAREVCEMALAHSVGDKTEAAYRRGDLFAKRRQLMEAWATFCTARRSPGNRRHRTTESTPRAVGNAVGQT